jgi:hypothetical protein
MDRPLPTEIGLAEAVLAALRPTGLRDRLRVRVTGGYTALQVWERLPGSVRDALGDPADVVAARRGVERVQRVLHGLVDAGRVERVRVKLNIALGSKGPRDVLVDAFRTR